MWPARFMWLSTLVAACHSQMFDPMTAMYGGGMGMYGNYNPFLYGGYGGANNMMMNPLMDSMAMNPYGTSGAMNPYGTSGMLGATLGLNSVNPYGAYFNNPMLSNFGSAGSPFGRQFRSRYGGSAKGVGAPSGSATSPTECGAAGGRGCAADNMPQGNRLLGSPMWDSGVSRRH